MTGPELRAWRTERRLSQTRLGERLGVRQATISDWERGVMEIQHPTILRLALSELDHQVDDDS